MLLEDPDVVSQVRLVSTDVLTDVISKLLFDWDNIVEIKYVKRSYVSFFKYEQTSRFVDIDKLPDIKDVSTVRNRFTQFDGLALSDRSLTYQQKVVDSFARSYLFAQSGADFESGPTLSNAVAYVIRSLLDNEQTLNAFLLDPEGFLTVREQETDSMLMEGERTAFLNLAQNADTLRRELDQVALGDSTGDGDTYILIGIESETGIPSKDALLWLHENLANFVGYHGYMPGYGGYVTEANLRNHVVLGPGATDRDRDFLARNGIKTYDRRDWQPIGTLE